MIIDYSLFKISSAFFDERFNGNHSITTLDGRTFIGNFKNGIMGGPGAVQFPNGNILIGKFQNGTLTGRVKMLLPGGGVENGNYIGPFAGHASRRTLFEGVLYPLWGREFSMKHLLASKR